MIRASSAAGLPEQLACIAAQDGTATGLAAGLGVGVGVGVGLGDGLSAGLGEGLALADGEGLLCAAVPVPEQPATASRANKAASRSPTVR